MFKLPNLPRETYHRLNKVCDDFDHTQVDVVVAGIELFVDYITKQGREAADRALKQAKALNDKSKADYQEYLKRKQSQAD